MEGGVGFEPALVSRREFVGKSALIAGISTILHAMDFIRREAVNPTIERERLTAQIRELAALGGERVGDRLRDVVQGAEDYWGLKINPNPMFLDKASSAVLLEKLVSVLAGVIPPNFYRDLQDTHNERIPGDPWGDPSLDWLSRRVNGVGGLYNGQGRVSIPPDLLYSDQRLLHAVMHESGHAVHDVLNGMAKLTALPHSQFENYDFWKITQAEDSFKYLTLEMQLRVRQLIGSNRGFVSWYAQTNYLERFAENFATLFTRTRDVLDHISRKKDSLTLEYLAMMDFLELVTKGAMDRRYYRDLAAGRVCPKYWEERVFEPIVRVARGAEEIYVTDLDRIDGGLPVLIRTRPISISDRVERVPWSAASSGVIDTTLDDRQVRISPESSTMIGAPKTVHDDPTMFGLDIWVREVPISLAVVSGSRPIEIMFQTLGERVILEIGLRDDGVLIHRETVRELIGVSSLESFRREALWTAEMLVLLASLDGVGMVTMAQLARIAIKQPNLIASLLFGEKENGEAPASAKKVPGPTMVPRRRFLKGVVALTGFAAAAGMGVVGLSQDPSEPLWERPSLARAAKGLTTRLQEARERIAMGSLPWSSSEKGEATVESNIEEITASEVPLGAQFMLESLGIGGDGNLRLTYSGTQQVMRWTRDGGFVIVPEWDAINTEIVPSSGQTAWGFYLGVDGLQRKGCGMISGAVSVLKELVHYQGRPFIRPNLKLPA